MSNGQKGHMVLPFYSADIYISSSKKIDCTFIRFLPWRTRASLFKGRLDAYICDETERTNKKIKWRPQQKVKPGPAIITITFQFHMPSTTWRWWGLSFA